MTNVTLPPRADESSIRYEGWRIVLVCFLLASFGWALGFYGQTVYLAELQRLHGWPASLISTATTFFYLFGALLVMFISDLIKRLGPRLCIVTGVLVMSLATVLLGQVTSPWQLFAAYALLAAGWAGTSLAVITNVIGLWFDTKRGMAISLALNGASLGGVFGVPLLVAAIGHFGFPQATMVVAGVGAAIVIPATLLFVGKPPQRVAPAVAPGTAPVAELSSGAIRAKALRDSAYLTLCISFAFVLFAQVAVIVHLVSLLDPIVGRAQAAINVSVMTVMAVAGRLLVGMFIDRFNQRLVSALSFCSQAIAVVLLINSRDPAVLLFACALFGFSVGNMITFPALILQREFDPRWFGVLISLLTAANQVTYAFGPAVVGLLKDLTGSYAMPLYLCVALQITGAVLVLRGRRAKAGDALV